MLSYDPALLAATPVSPKTMADVAVGMQAMDAVLPAGDGLKWFHWLYMQVTGAVRSRIAAGGFARPEWVAELDVQFASLYFGALRRALQRQPAPACWRALFDRRTAAPVARIQFALAGANAHINHDLPAALCATCRATNTVPLHGTPEYNDYCAVNGTLEGLIPASRRELMVRLLGDDLPPVSHLEQTLAAWSLTAAREGAWNNAEVLWHLAPVPRLASQFLDSLDGLATVAGKTLLAPVPETLAQAAAPAGT